MSQKLDKHNVIVKRLSPLYIAAFLQSFVLWYAIEKVFMHAIGFDDTGIGLMIAMYSVIVLLLETPSGIIADRWSRKGVLAVGSIFLVLSSFVGGVSAEPIMYLIAASLWGVFDALYSGMYDSIIYDTVQEETGASDGYERYDGHIQVAQSAALVASAIVGGFLADKINMPATYFLTIPIAAISAILLWRFKEPQLHKEVAGDQGTFTRQIKDTLRAVTAKGTAVRLMIVMVLITIVLMILYEFSTLWLIASGTPTVLYGPGFAVALAAIGFGGLLAGWGSKIRRFSMIFAFGVMLVSTIALALPVPLAIILVAQFVLGATATMLSIMVMRDVHDLLPSHLRAGSSSAVNTFARIIIIPLALVFGAISTHVSIFAAGWITVVFAALALAIELKQRFVKKPA